MSVDLKTRAIRSGGWAFGGKFSARILQVLKVFIMARLLTPEDFGLFGVVLMVTTTLEAFTQTGFNTALIHQKEVSRHNLDTAWTIHVLRGALLALVLFAFAPLISTYFRDERLLLMLRAISLVEILRGSVNIGIIHFDKELLFQRKIIYEVASNSINVAVAILLALAYRSAWALVGGYLAGAIAQGVLSYALHPFRPHPRLDLKRAKQLHHYGKWMLGTSIVFFISSKYDSVVLGRAIGIRELGYYQMAYMLATMPATEVINVLGSVLLAVFSKMQDEKEKLAATFRDVFECIMTFSVPLCAYLILTAPELIFLLLGEEWAGAVEPLQILAVGGLALAITATGGPLFQGIGKPHMDFWMNTGSAVTVILSINPLANRYGLNGVAMSMMFSFMARIPFWCKGLLMSGVHPLSLLPRFGSGLVLSLCVGAGAALAWVLPPLPPHISLLLKTLPAMLMSCGVIYWMTFHRECGAGRSFIRVFRSLKKRDQAS